MTWRIASFLLLAPFTVTAACADDGQVWTSLGASGPIAGKLRGSLDGVARFDRGGLYEWVAAAAIGYRLDGHATLWAGYVHKTGYANNVTSTEQRAREDLTFDDVARIGPIRVGGRVRAEERWIAGRPGTGWRARPLLRLTLPLTRDGPALVAAAEAFVNLDGGAGQRTGYDRTRASFGVTVPLNRSIHLDAGYLRQWTRRADTVDAATAGVGFCW